jgi:hypothetical protein
VSWYPVHSTLLKGYRLHASKDGTTFAVEGSLIAASETSTVVAATDERCFKVSAVDDRGVEGGESPAYGIASSPTGSPVLVVDGFVRTTGRQTDPAHALAALVGRSVATSGHPYETASSRAVRDGSVSLAGAKAVVWMCGDQSTLDAALDRVEEHALVAFLEAGGKLFISGSEIGFDLTRKDGSPDDKAFFQDYLGGVFGGDAAKSHDVTGLPGPFQDLAFSFGGNGSAYGVPYPDFFTAGKNATLVLHYGDGSGAGLVCEGALGAGKARAGVVYLGFPVETVEPRASRDTLVGKALAWLDGVRTGG